MTSPVTDLTPEQREFLDRMEPLWHRAQAIVEKHPRLDISDVFHTLVNFQRTPAERLRRGLTHGRAGARGR